MSKPLCDFKFTITRKDGRMPVVLTRQLPPNTPILAAIRELAGKDEIVRFDGAEWPSHAWPGGYPMYLVAEDCGTLCPKCANKSFKRTLDVHDKQYHVVGQHINWEDEDLYCDDCGEQIESAYGPVEREAT